jgi:hypothetical protein
MSRRVKGCVTGFFVVCWGGSLLIAYSEPYQPPLHPHNVTLPTAILPPDLVTVLMPTITVIERTQPPSGNQGGGQIG